MSQSESESDIWEYRSLKRTKRQTAKSPADGSKRRKLESKKKAEKTLRGCRLSTDPRTVTNLGTESESVHVTKVDGAPRETPRPSGTQSAEMHDGSSSEQPPQSSAYCPVCQMPFSILVAQTAHWHVAECLENPGEPSKGRSLHQDTHPST